MTKQPYLAEDYVSTGEAATLLHVKRQTILSMLKRGELTTIPTPGKHNRIPMSEINEYLESHTKPKVPE